MTFIGTLLPYQHEAVDKMCARGSMLVAYDLGLGKTVITIAALERLMDDGSIKEPGLVIALSTLKFQWSDSIGIFSDSTALVIDGTKSQREAQYRRAMNWRDEGIDYVILNYEQVVNDWAQVNQLPRGFVVLDEATAIKSFRAKRAKHVKRLDSPFRFALTGTPIENGKPEELYSIMQFVDPEVLGRFDLFDVAFMVRNPFGGVERYRNLDVLHRRMAPVLARKTKDDEDVRGHLPESVYLPPLRVRLDRAAAGLYRKVAGDLIDDLDEAQSMFGSSFNLLSHYGYQSDQGGPGDELRGRLMSKITALRMLCDHPALLEASADQFARHTGSGSAYVHGLREDGLLDGLNKAPKLEALVSYLGEFLETDPGNKAVVFSVFVPTLDLICERLAAHGPVQYSGRLSAKEKDRNKKEFQTDPSRRVLVSSDAGGYGVDLPQANLLVNYDLPWSAGTAEQRGGRIRRASSEFETVVYQDIVVAGSVEERQLEALRRKGGVATAIVDGLGIDERGGVGIAVGSLRAFLLENSV